MNNKPYFTLLWTLTLVVSGVMVLIGISLVPHFRDIGNVASIVVYIYLGCAAAIGPAFTLYKLYRWYIERNVITRGEVVATIDSQGKMIDHLSAAHEQAKIPRLLPAPKDEPAFLPDEESFINIYNSSEISLKELAARFENMSYYQAQKLYADAKKKGLITR
jgi:hypothetical protein